MLTKVRKRWEDCLNSYYSAKGLAKRVSCESNKERGIQEIPTIHEGPHGKRSSGDRREINRTIRQLNNMGAIKADTVSDAMEMMPSYMDGLERELAEKNARQKKLVEEIEKSLEEVRLSERQRKQLKLLLASLRKVVAEYDDPHDVADALKDIVLRGGTGGGMYDRLRRSLPPRSGDREIVWARDGISLLSSLFANPQGETLAKLRQWTEGPLLWTSDQSPAKEKGVGELLEYLHEESEFMPLEENNKPDRTI